MIAFWFAIVFIWGACIGSLVTSWYVRSGMK